VAHNRVPLPERDQYSFDRGAPNNKTDEFYKIHVIEDLAAAYSGLSILLGLKTANDQSFGYNGEYTAILTQAFQAVKDFWGIPNDNTTLVAVHGQDLEPLENVVLAFQGIALSTGIPITQEQALAKAQATQVFINTTIQNYSSPILSMIANIVFEGADVSFSLIFIGDGLLSFLERQQKVSGIGGVYTVAHEYAHQVQFHSGRYGNLTRWTREREADAMAGYFIKMKRTQSDSHNSPLAAGLLFDCGQAGQWRSCAAEWGTSLVANIANDQQQFDYLTFASEFAKVEDLIEALDESTCPRTWARATNATKSTSPTLAPTPSPTLMSASFERSILTMTTLSALALSFVVF
jgi:hypothetical protein